MPLAVLVVLAACARGEAIPGPGCVGGGCQRDAGVERPRRDAPVAGQGGVLGGDEPGSAVGGAGADLAPGEPADAAPEASPDAPEEAPPPPPAPTPLITFSRPSGAFTTPFSVLFEPSAASVRVHVTSDGSLPRESEAIAGPALVNVDRSMQVRVAAIDDASGWREQHGIVYLQTTPELAGFRSDLPIVLLHALGATEPPIDRFDHTAGAMLVLRPEGGVSQLAGTVELASRVGWKVRGRTSREFDQRSFGVELWGVLDGQGRAAPLLGLPPESDWVLHGPDLIDRSLVRNALVHALGRRVFPWSPRTRFVEVFVESAGRPLSAASYRGVYTLIEKIKRDPHRVNITRLRQLDAVPPGITGGYIFKVDDHLAPGEVGLVAGGEKLELEEPEPEEATVAQRAYLTGYLDEMVAALAAPGGRHPMTGLHYSEYLDVDSWIDFHIVNVFVRNPDALRLSAYYHKDRGGKVVAGPLWDFDRSTGAHDFRDRSPIGWSVLPDGTDVFKHGWWKHLFADPAFEERYWRRWQALLDTHLRREVLVPLVTSLVAEVQSAQPRHVARWPKAAPEAGYSAEIANLVTWLDARLAWTRANLRVR